MTESLAIVGAILLILLFLGFYTVEQQKAAIIERFGKFVRISSPGLNVKIPLIEKIAGHVSLRILQLDVEIETKTLDDVFVRILTSVQYRVLDTKIYEAFYTLENPAEQIQAFVFDVVRARVPKIRLDDVFSKKDEIADSVREELHAQMSEFGFDIIKTLVTDIHPDDKVKAAMNEINESQRLRVAANERGEAEKILRIKQAEAEAESKILQGRGIAGQRAAIVDGLRDSLMHLQKDVVGTSTHDVMTMVLMTQYFDTLRELSAHSKLSSILLPHSPSAITDVADQIRTAILAAEQVGRAHSGE